MDNVTQVSKRRLGAHRLTSCRLVAQIAATLLGGALTAQAAEDPLAARPAETSNIVTHALADGPANCAARYHAKLGSDVLAKAHATLSVAASMRREVVEMPGYWQFWDGNGIAARNAYQQRLLVAKPINRAENRMCVRSILARGGRIRCMKWQPIPEGYKPPPPVVPTVDPSKPEISPAERRIAAGLGSRVVGKGAFRELAHGDAFYHMAQRTSDELIAYTGQPYRKTLCTGTNELIGFYRRQLEPLSLKVNRAEKLKIETRTAAHATTRVALGEESNSALSPDPPNYTATLRLLLKPALEDHEYSALTASDNPFAVLTHAREIVSDLRFDAMPKKERGRLRKALRNIEFALYADYSIHHLRRLSTAFEAVFGAIRAAHAKACTCKQPQ